MTRTPVRTSAWDTPTPSHLSSIDEPRLTSGVSLETPLPTPSHLYNEWANDRKSFGISRKKQGLSNYMHVRISLITHVKPIYGIHFLQLFYERP